MGRQRRGEREREVFVMDLTLRVKNEYSEEFKEKHLMLPSVAGFSLLMFDLKVVGPTTSPAHLLYFIKSDLFTHL